MSGLTHYLHPNMQNGGKHHWFQIFWYGGGEAALTNWFRFTDDVIVIYMTFCCLLLQGHVMINSGDDHSSESYNFVQLCKFKQWSWWLTSVLLPQMEKKNNLKILKLIALKKYN